MRCELRPLAPHLLSVHEERGSRAAPAMVVSLASIAPVGIRRPSARGITDMVVAACFSGSCSAFAVSWASVSGSHVIIDQRLPISDTGAPFARCRVPRRVCHDPRVGLENTWEALVDYCSDSDGGWCRSGVG